MNENRKINDADISSAGDDFHVLWTIKKSLELLNFDDSGIKAVYIEGVELSESEQLDPTGSNLLGVDLSEYYGADNYEEAIKVVVSQLKYSTLRSNKPYTIGELYIGKKSKSREGSLIHRLANIFKLYLDEFGRDSVLEKISIKLVTNREFNQNHLTSINNIKTYLLKKKGKVSFNKVLIDNPKNSFTLKKLFLASKLKVNEFTDFIRILDFDDCGVASRYNLKIQLYKAISSATYTSKIQYNQLRELVIDKMMPEARNRRKITVTDIVANLGFNDGGIENLFPVSQSLKENKNSVLREQLSSINSVIESNNSYIPICIHGGAGIGKSTIIQQIQEFTPKNNICILFDCYGSGSYQNPEDKRHLHKNGLLHISNTIAKIVGTDFLITHQQQDNDVYLKEFRKRIVYAIDILKEREANATLTIIIDAADNSITAAENDGDESFVKDILNMNIPNGCNLIVTTRTHRKITLKLPEEHISIELLPFSLIETSQFIKSYFMDINNEDISEFHKYTYGIPRAQFYSIDLKKKGIKEIVNFLKPNGKTVELIILDRIKEAKNKVSNNEKKIIDTFFKLLIGLPRPIPISYLAEILNIEHSFLLDIKSEVWNGLIYDNGYFEFRDEDFENYIRDNYSLSDSQLKEITKIFLEKAEHDSYASINLGSLLFQSKQNDLLKQIVLKREYLLLPEDPIKNRETYINRTKLAMKFAGKIEDNLAYFKLIFIAAEEAKKEKALLGMLTNYPDLVSTFGDDSSLKKLKLNSSQKSWAGSFHMKLSGIYSRDPKNKKIALKHLKTAREWLNWRSNSVKNDDLDKYHISSKDIAYYTEAIVRIKGLDDAVYSLNKWKPRDVRLWAGNYLIENIYLFNKEKQIKSDFKIEKLRIDAQIFLVCKAYKFKKENVFSLDKVAEKIERILVKKEINFTTTFKILLVDFCEILALNNIDKTLIIKILNFIKCNRPNYIPSFYKSFNNDKEVDKFSLFFKVESLKKSLKNQEVIPNDILPEKFKNIEKITDYKERGALDRSKKEFVNFYNYVLPIFQLNSDFSCRNLSEKDSITKFKKICKVFANDYNFRYESGHSYKEKLNYLVSFLASFSTKLDENDLINLIIESVDTNSSKVQMRFCVIEEIIHLQKYTTTSLKLLNEIDELLKDDSRTSTQITESYIKCTLLSQKIDYSTGEYYFNEAIKAIEDVDLEVFSKIRCLSSLSDIGFDQPDSKLAFEYARFTEFSDLKLDGYDKKYFPYEEALIGISNIDFNSMFSAASRWHHRDVINLPKYIVAILKQSLEKGNIDHIIAGSLIPMYNYNYYTNELMELYDIIFSKYDEFKDSIGKTKFVELIYRNCLLYKDKDTLKYVYNKIKSGAFINQKSIIEIESYLSFRKGFEGKKEIYSSNNSNKDKYSANLNLDEIDLNSTRALEKVINSITASSDSYSNRLTVDVFLKEIKNKCLPINYVNQLNAIIDINSELLSFYSFEDAIKERLTEWSFHASVKEWKKEKFRYVLLTWFENFDYGNTLNTGKILEFSKMFQIDEIQLGEVIISVLPEKIETLSDESIYSAFSLLKHRLTKKENTEIFNWILPRWNKNIKPSLCDGIWDNKFLPPNNSNETIAKMLRLFLGLPDKEIRWQAIHSIRRLVNLNNTNILSELIKNQNKTDCTPFQNEGYIFYWISAKLYLWIAIERISNEVPEKLIDFKNDFILELQNKDLPHVLINYFIKKVCKNLLKHDVNVYNTKECEIIEDSLTSKFEKVSEKRYTRKQRKYKLKSKEDWRFDFDSMDVLPYWYNKVGDLFNLSEFDVADIADKYIVERWGYIGDVNEDDYTRNYDWSLRDKRQGSNPQIESLDTYFEYHAMFCAANELLEKEPLLKEQYNDEDWDSWLYWLESKAITWDGFWYSDLRDPLPLMDKFWKNEYLKLDKDWRDTIEESKFDDEVGFSNYYDDSFIIPYGGYTRYFGDNSESVVIKSALVSNKGSLALLKAFQSAEDHHDYSFPLESDDERFEINNSGFIFKSWLKENSETGYDGLDKHDYLAKKIGSSIMSFNTEIQDFFKIKFNSNLKIAYKNNQRISSFEFWDEKTESRYRSAKEIESSGEILKVDINFILEILKKQNMSMLIKCQVTKQLKESQYRSDNRKQPWEHTKIYLLKSDGKVETIRGGNFKIR